MYTKLFNREELEKRGDILKQYKLCYIDEIPDMILDDTPETKAFKQTKEYQRLLQKHDSEMKAALEKNGHYKVDINDYFYRQLKSQLYPNPELVPGKSTHFAYFTPRPLKEQYGDDWNDKPYNCNAEKPYDVMEDVVEIIIIPFYLRDTMLLPCSGVLNCPYSVVDINNGAVAWIYNTESGSSIQAGVNPIEFVDRIWREED